MSNTSFIAIICSGFHKFNFMEIWKLLSKKKTGISQTCYQLSVRKRLNIFFKLSNCFLMDVGNFIEMLPTIFFSCRSKMKIHNNEKTRWNKTAKGELSNCLDSHFQKSDCWATHSVTVSTQFDFLRYKNNLRLEERLSRSDISSVNHHHWPCSHNLTSVPTALWDK